MDYPGMACEPACEDRAGFLPRYLRPPCRGQPGASVRLGEAMSFVVEHDVFHLDLAGPDPVDDLAGFVLEYAGSFAHWRTSSGAVIWPA
jgi:hypothetical protein